MQNPNWPLSSWQANFVAGANDPEPTGWDDLSDDRVVSYTVGAGKQFELDAAESGTADVRCRNIDEWLNPANTASPWNSAGKSLKPYRRIRHWDAWPLAGNFLNASNDPWTAARSSGTLADTASFEGGTAGTWAPVAGCTIGPVAAPGAVWSFDWVLGLDVVFDDEGFLPPSSPEGARSLHVTWGTTAGGAGVAELAAVSVPLKGATTYTASLRVYLGGGPAVTLACQGHTVTSSTTTGVWQRLTLTWTANNQPTDLRLYAAGATAGQQVWVDSVQVELGSTASAWTATGPVIYPVHTGYIERYPLTWEANGYEGWAELTSVDALALLSRVISRDVVTQDCLQDRPAFLWPLDDAQGVAVAVNIGFQAPAAGQMWLAPMGTPTGQTTTFGGSGSPGVDSSSSLTFAPTSADSTYVPLVDWSGHSGYTVGDTTGYTAELWFLGNPPATGATPHPMRVLRLWGAANEEHDITIDATGCVVAEHHSTAGTVDSTVTSPGTYLDGGWHHAVITATWAAGTVTETLWVDGQKIGQATRVAAGTMVAFGAMLGYDYWAGSSSFAGSMSRFAIYPTPLPDARIVSHWLAARTGFAGDTTDVRIRRLLAWAGWTGRTSIPVGLSRHGALSGMDGTTILDACKTAAVTERGTFYAATDGRLTLVPRSAYYRQTSALRTFGENAPGGETPYLDAAAELDPTFIYNQVTVTRSSGSAQVASDVTSESDYGVRTTSVSTSHATDTDASSMAAFLITQYADGRLRVPELSIDPVSNPALWPVALGTQFGDRVTWKRRTSAGLTVVLDGFVQAVSHDVAVDSWTAKFTLAPVDTFQPGLIGDATYGVVGSTLITAY